MKEFMLLIRNGRDSKHDFSDERENQFLKACEVYINDLKRDGNLVSAQPLLREGKMIAGSTDAFTDGPYSTDEEVIVGYYHVRANNLDEAIELAKRNPEFAFTKTARVEVRPIKTKEQSTQYVYPKG